MRTILSSDVRILIAEDDEIMAQNLENILLDLGYQHITKADDGLMALQKLTELQKAGQTVELVISDWVMPNMTGIDFLKMIRSNSDLQNTLVVFLTSQASMEQVVDAISSGVDAYLVKPVNKDALTKKLITLEQKFAENQKK